MAKKKLKTKKTLAQRVRVTKTGKILKKQVRTRHLKVKWNTARKHRKKRLKEQENIGHKKLFKKLLAKGSKGI